ncbi:aldehyde dehydrogenase (NADP(+)) [Rugosimonospora acidiphila]|uniref:Aldehyde dehydrogenase (NADP(+)) n=1 Tax=Rugosimonospora acidiphila TaxID=556531 RepID=A0ABP9SHU2_9ACTN
MSEFDVWSIDARTGEKVEAVASTTTDAEVDAAATRSAEVAPLLVAAGLAGRARLLRAMADEIEKDGEAIIAAADRESALGQGRLSGELARSAYQLRLFAEVLDDGGHLELTIDHADPKAIPAPRPDLRRMLVPVGPVGVFSASNFPLAFSVPGGDTASAIAAGCPVVVKAHSGHPYTSQLAAAALRRAAASVAMPEDVVQVVHGRQAGTRLVVHPAIQAVGFTGSVGGGRALFDLAVARPQPIPFYGELGSINPFVVTPEAAAQRAESIAAGLAGSFTLGVGQFCTKPGLVFVPANADGQRLVAALGEAAGTIAGGPMLTPSIRDSFLSGAKQRAELPGVRAVLSAAGQISPHVLVASATALDDVLLEECFGPLVVVVEYGDESELFAALDRVPGSLTASVHCGDSEGAADSFAARVADRVTGLAGRILFNGYPTGVAVTWAQQHGGPWPATTFPHHTSVGTTAIRRFLRPVAFQDAPAGLLPAELREDNPLGLPRRVDGRYELHA